MKTQTMVAVTLAVPAAIWCMAHAGAAQESVAAPAPGLLSGIAVVSVEKVINSSKKNADYISVAKAEQAKIFGELQALNRDVESEQAQIKTLVPGSDDYLSQLKSLLEKQAKGQTLQEYYTQRSQAKEKQWAEQFYKEVLQAVQQVAESKGLSLVLERTDPQFPMPGDRLLSVIRSHKVLYTKGCVDISDEVLALIDKK